VAGAIALIALVALLAPLIAPHDPLSQDLSQRVKSPSWSHLLGTDQVGRDILSRIIYGGRISLMVGFVSVTVSGCVGVLLGMLSGHYAGWLSNLIMRIADLQLTFPFLAIAVSVVAVLGTSTPNLVLVLALWSWPSFARVTRGEVLSVSRQDYVGAARALGANDRRILGRHVLPNIFPSVIVIWTFMAAKMILLEASLSFLGLGVAPPTPSWGSMINEGQNLISVAWWLETFPGLAILVTVLAVNQLGDALRDVLDPRLQVTSTELT
jgi:peptide/nickel transport system permease protein